MMFQTDPDPASRQFVGVVLGIGVIVSTLLSIWSISIDSVINNDGVEYYRVAELFSSGDWRSGLEIYRWPFYPWLMMIVGDTIGMSYKTAGHVLNTIFFALIVVFFVSAVRSLGGRSKSITTIAMVIALVHPAFNEYRAFLIRDPGYLAAYLLAVCCLFQYRRSRNARYIFGTAGSFFIAGLFRIEGLVFLFSTPLLFSLMNPRAVRYSHHWLPLVVSMISVLILIAVLGYWVFPSSESFDDFSLVSDPIGFVTAAWHQIAVGVDTKLVVLREFLGPYSESDAYVLYGLAVIAVMVVAILAELTVPVGLLAGYALIKKSWLVEEGLYKLWVTLILINAVVLLGFAWIMVFLAPRYPLAITMTLLISVPFVAVYWWSRFSIIRLNLLWRITIVVLIVWATGESISGVGNFSRNEHHREAGTWLAQQTQQQGALITNSRKVAFYANRYSDANVWEPNVITLLQGLKDNRWTHSQFAAIRVEKNEENIEAEFNRILKQKPEHIFHNGRGDRILLYDYGEFCGSIPCN